MGDKYHLIDEHIKYREDIQEQMSKLDVAIREGRLPEVENITGKIEQLTRKLSNDIRANLSRR